MDGWVGAAGCCCCAAAVQGSQEWVLLLPYVRGPLMVLLLLHADADAPSAGVLDALADILEQGAAPVMQQLVSELPQYNLWHRPGFRYCYADAAYGVSRFTPGRKVGTLTPHAQRIMADLRNKLALQQALQGACALAWWPRRPTTHSLAPIACWPLQRQMLPSEAHTHSQMPS